MLQSQHIGMDLLKLAVRKLMLTIIKGASGRSDSKESACNAGDLGLIPGWGRSPGEGNGNPLQCSCLENSMGRGACSPWGLQSMGSQRVRHNWVINTHTYIINSFAYNSMSVIYCKLSCWSHNVLSFKEDWRT